MSELHVFEEVVLREKLHRVWRVLDWLRDLIYACRSYSIDLLVRWNYIKWCEDATYYLLIGPWRSIMEYVEKDQRDGVLFILGVKRKDDKIIRIWKEVRGKLREYKYVADCEWIVFGFFGEGMPILEVCVRRENKWWKEEAWHVEPEDTKVLALWFTRKLTPDIHDIDCLWCKDC